ncbi:MAG: helix-turn-helix domain-containing protein [Cyclobacteriaceae bacterium]
MTTQFLLAIFSGIVVLNSIFFGVVLLLNAKGLLKNRLLGLILLGIALRTGKSILLLLLPDVPETIPAIGLVGMGAIGPLLYLYVQHLSSEKWKKLNHLHFLFSLVMGFSLLFAKGNTVFWLYFVTAVQMVSYLVLAILTINKHKREYSSEELRWVKFLATVIALVWSIYAAQLFFQGAIAYLIGTVTASIALFALLFKALQSNRIFVRTKRITQTEGGKELVKKVLAAMEKEELYKDSELTLPKLARLIGVKPYVLSGVLNDYHKKSFPEFVNEYRIKEAQKLLLSAQHQVYSIEAIAFDCGFNTPSAFYTYFKRFTKVTPAEYRDREMAQTAVR